MAGVPHPTSCFIAIPSVQLPMVFISVLPIYQERSLSSMPLLYGQVAS
jgi:hypothetical protein